METISNYLDTMFKTLPQTDKMLQLKEELLQNMEEKYQELKAQGCTENEAVGKVISEFGNVDELIKEMDMDSTEANTQAEYVEYTEYAEHRGYSEEDNYEGIPMLTYDDAEEYISGVRTSNLIVSAGVALILCGVAVLIFLSAMLEGTFLSWLPESFRDGAPIVCFFLFLVPAVGLFVFSDYGMNKYKYIQKGRFRMDRQTRDEIYQLYQSYQQMAQSFTVVGVVLCVLSPVPVIAGGMFGDSGSIFGVSILLILVAIAIAFFINGEAGKDACKKLLKKSKKHSY